MRQCSIQMRTMLHQMLVMRNLVMYSEEEISLVCLTGDVPEQTIEREDGWKGFRVQAILDFSLVGILSKISGILAELKKEQLYVIATLPLMKQRNIQNHQD